VSKSDKTMRRSLVLNRCCCFVLLSLSMVDAQWLKYKDIYSEYSKKDNRSLLNLIRARRTSGEKEQR